MLILFVGGSMLSVDEHMDEVPSIQEELGARGSGV